MFVTPIIFQFKEIFKYAKYSKITIIQGDSGEGKTSFVLAMIALLTTGKPLPEEKTAAEPISVIYQSAEDGLADTIIMSQSLISAIALINAPGK